jgi:hypothetical protein
MESNTTNEHTTTNQFDLMEFDPLPMNAVYEVRKLVKNFDTDMVSVYGRLAHNYAELVGIYENGADEALTKIYVSGAKSLDKLALDISDFDHGQDNPDGEVITAVNRIMGSMIARVSDDNNIVNYEPMLPGYYVDRARRLIVFPSISKSTNNAMTDALKLVAYLQKHYGMRLADMKPKRSIYALQIMSLDGQARMLDKGDSDGGYSILGTPEEWKSFFYDKKGENFVNWETARFRTYVIEAGIGRIQPDIAVGDMGIIRNPKNRRYIDKLAIIFLPDEIRSTIAQDYFENGDYRVRDYVEYLVDTAENQDDFMEIDEKVDEFKERLNIGEDDDIDEFDDSEHRERMVQLQEELLESQDKFIEAMTTGNVDEWFDNANILGIMTNLTEDGSDVELFAEPDNIDWGYEEHMAEMREAKERQEEYEYEHADEISALEEHLYEQKLAQQEADEAKAEWEYEHADEIAEREEYENEQRYLALQKQNSEILDDSDGEDKESANANN